MKNDPELKKIILDIHTLEKKLGIKRETKASAKVERKQIVRELGGINATYLLLELFLVYRDELVDCFV